MENDSTTILNTLFGDTSRVFNIENSEIFNVINITEISLTDNLYFKILVLIFAVFYLIWMAKFVDIKKIINKAITLKYNDEQIFEKTSIISKKFTKLAIFLWIPTCGITLVKLLDVFLIKEINEIFHAYTIYSMIIPSCLLFIMIWIYKQIMLNVIGKLTLSPDFIKQVNYIKELFTCLCTIFITPITILFALYNGSLLPIFAILCILIAVFITILWLYKTYMLFISKKVSSLNWILYLCTIEIFPITLILFLIK